MDNSDFDLIVLGAGSGGIAAAIRAAEHGARVALLEPGELGGTCVNAGCVPKKAMWLAADLALMQKTATALCFNGDERTLDWPRFIEHRQRYIGNIHASYRQRLDDLGIVTLCTRGRVLGAGLVSCLDDAHAGWELAGRMLLIATGGRSRRAPIPGGELGIDSDGFFDLEHPPPAIALVGGGYIAVELAGILSALGSRVRMLVRGQRLLEHFDAELSDVAAAHLKHAGVDLRFGVEVGAVTREGSCYRLQTTEDASGLVVDELLWAIGRTPNTDGLGLEGTGVRLDDDGHIEVDAHGRTAVPGIHAIGDVASLGPHLTPLAVRAGRALSDQLYGGALAGPLLEGPVPTVVFGRPPLGSIGDSEAQARERWGDDAVQVYRGRFRPMLAALAGSELRALVKLVCVGEEQRVVGLHVAGPGADEMLQGFAVAMRMGATKADFDATVAIHPTASEELVLLR